MQAEEVTWYSRKVSTQLKLGYFGYRKVSCYFLYSFSISLTLSFEIEYKQKLLNII